MIYDGQRLNTLSARNGHRPVGVIFARISTDKQNELSNQEQAAKCREYITRRFGVEPEYRIIAGQGSGERLDRKELEELEAEIRSGRIDFVIAEELSRFSRRSTALDLCDRCEDYDVRLFAVNDGIDTFDDSWRDRAAMSTWHHERSNRDAAERITRSLRHRFETGGIIQCVPFGFVKPPGTRLDSQLTKDPQTEPVVHEMFDRLRAGASYSEVASWLNQQGIKPGPFCRRRRWNGAMVSRTIHNPLFKGVRVRNRHMTRRINRTGRHVTVKAPANMLKKRYCAHLEYLREEDYDALIAQLRERNAWCRRSPDGTRDPLAGRPKKLTKFPGQHLRCGICGRVYHWHGANTRRVMVCSGATDYRCWNSLYVNGKDCAKAVLGRVAKELARLPGFQDVFGDLVREEAARLDEDRRTQQRALERRIAEAEARKANLLSAIESRPDNTSLLERLDDAEAALIRARYELRSLEQRPAIEVALPEADELRQQLAGLLVDAAGDDQAINRRLQQVIPKMFIVPYRTIDGGDIVPRVEFTLDLAALLPTELKSHPAAEQFQKSFVVTVGRLPQRIEFHEQATALRAQGLTRLAIADRLGLSLSACANALRINREMKAEGLDEPYRRLTELGASMNRLRRHRAKQFVFEPLDGFPLPN